ncbi:MAG TPA: ATP synthase F1 subunit gamma [Candidatus Saccharimonadales bacterium]|nr:ATP synthase F1 subunit gamma [Candidatus Saccharimonadales bacterium]
MASDITAIKRRIGSVKNTRQITRAMELVAASKMKKAQVKAQATRDYRVSAQGILGRLAGISDVSRHPLFKVRDIKVHLILVISSDLGLAGGYDANVFKKLTEILKNNTKHKVKIIAVGKKGSQFISRLKGMDMISAYGMFSDNPTPADIRPLINDILKRYEEGSIDKASIIYTEFISNLSQEVKILDLLPASISVEAEDSKLSPLEVGIFEPNIDEIVEDAVMRLIEVQVWQALLESLASEYSMRMVAMKNASDNAKDIIDDLTLEYNTARQAVITQEIAEIVGGAEAVR